MKSDTTHWLFGYGSLIFKVDFPVIESRVARLDGWARRFWQGSHDHRGTPEAPGRVVTLIKSPESVCVGMAHHINANVFHHLDHREKDGYERHQVALTLEDAKVIDATMYVAAADNPSFLGPDPLPQIAHHIGKSRGPSGSNLAYFSELRTALKNLGEVDDHIEAIAGQLDERS